MISPDYVRTMATYNRWQNGSLYDAANTLSDDERKQARGAFFGSIHATLNHILWGDQIWMSRFTGAA
ncbi:MAG: damage-inducible protein DinB, partial [Rhodospirillaceae bacterium]|nr:damage-inducible protein DinB [Rhodospirillaceae bacterium]